jgi:hypothetical protein
MCALLTAYLGSFYSSLSLLLVFHQTDLDVFSEQNEVPLLTKCVCPAFSRNTLKAMPTDGKDLARKTSSKNFLLAFFIKPKKTFFTLRVELLATPKTKRQFKLK